MLVKGATGSKAAILIVQLVFFSMTTMLSHKISEISTEIYNLVKTGIW